MIPAIQVKGLSKTYKEYGIKAVDDVNLVFSKGSITCIVGENGAGKSTLMNLLYGMERPDAGTIEVDGKQVSFSSPAEALQVGIGMVHQHFMLFAPFSIAKNVVLGMEPRTFLFFYDKNKAEQKVQALLDRQGFPLKASRKVKQLGVGEKQLVEITKMLYRKSKILILDEPTSMLTEQETKSLFRTLAKLKTQGNCIILITHKIKEVMEIADSIVVMRKGKLVGNYRKQEVDQCLLSKLMVGSAVTVHRMEPSDLRNKMHTKAILRADDIWVEKNNEAKPLLHDISFTVHAGEVLGFCGVSGNGMGVLEAVLGGMLPTSRGTIRLKGKDITNLGARKLRHMGLAFVPSNRIHYGCGQNATVEENLVIDERQEYFSLQKDSKKAFVDDIIGNCQITGQLGQAIGQLSGGNIQKVIFSREIHNMEDYIVLANPTWGLDVAATTYVHDRIRELQAKGKAIILLSSNLDEIMELSDRVNILHDATIAAQFEMTPAITKTVIGCYMLGIGEKQA
ncbi:MAG: ABC transporter ATP-binding protein [Spirochaetia bacterium]|jgi:simple sugar transport system ATP-binding protein|nr:ABC transporter ATP-binding protein [Spirochaetia bacterium]